MRVVRPRRIAVFLLGLLLASGCRAEKGSWQGEGTYALQGVVLILLDTVRADRLGCYGYERRPTSPNLDALARTGVRFAQTVAPAPWTLPSMAALLSGQYSERVFEDTLGFSIVEAFHDAGIETVAFTEGGFVSRAFAFDRGFDEWTEEEGAVQLLRNGQQRDPGKTGGIARTFTAVERWLSKPHAGRFFLFVHTYEPHTPYTNHDFTRGLDPGRVGPVFTLRDVHHVKQQTLVLTAAETAYVEALYDGDIASTDRHVGRLLRALDTFGLADRVAVIVTSDHGEGLGAPYPHNTADHGHALLDALVMVPLIIRDPTDAAARGVVVEEQVRTIDILPTVASLMQVPLAGPLDGRSLLPLLHGEEDGERLALIGQTKAGPPRVGLRTMGHKYIKTLSQSAEGFEPLDPPPPERQLYDLRNDPRERDNLVDRRPELATALDTLLERQHPGKNVRISPAAVNQVDPELRERLRSLGYLP